MIVVALSTSVAVTVVTAVLFSATLTEAVLPPPLDVITGASLTLVTVIVNAWLVGRPPASVEVTVTLTEGSASKLRLMPVTSLSWPLTTSNRLSLTL